MWSQPQVSDGTLLDIHPRGSHFPVTPLAPVSQPIVVVRREHVAGLSDGLEEPAVVAGGQVDDLPVTGKRMLLEWARREDRSDVDCAPIAAVRCRATEQASEDRHAVERRMGKH